MDMRCCLLSFESYSTHELIVENASPHKTHNEKPHVCNDKSIYNFVELAICTVLVLCDKALHFQLLSELWPCLVPSCPNAQKHD